MSKQTHSTISWIDTIVICLGTLLGVFGIYEVLIRMLSPLRDDDMLYRIHIFFDIGTIVLIALLVSLYLFRRHLRDFHQSEWVLSYASQEIPDLAVRKTLRWFVGLRWIAFTVTGIFLVAGVYVLKEVREDSARLPLTAVTLLVGLSNLWFYSIRKKIPPRKNFQLQILSDIILLTLLLHFSGGVENPLLITYIFHVILSSILLPPKQAYGFTLLICLFFGTSIGLEFLQWIPHYTLNLFPHSHSDVHAAHQLHFVLATMGVFVMVMFLTAYFATTLAEGLRRKARLEKARTQELLQATKMATMGEMVGFIAHEINNPIGVITLKIKKLLLASEISAKNHQKLQVVDKHIERISQIIHSLLGFARPSKGHQEIIDPCELIQESLHITERMLEKKNISLRVRMGLHLPPLRGNFTELQQVFLNLVNNAIDAMASGGVLTIHVYPHRSAEDDREEFCLAIEDTGDGIAPENQKNVFKSFYSTKGKDGSGLGLAVSVMLVKNHGGRIELESTPGRGTTFRVFFPFQKGEHYGIGK